MKNLNQFLNGMSTDEFLKTYWNKKPLLIKAAVSDVEKLATREELIDFAMDEDFESRIIYENSSEYKVKDGPISKSDMTGKYTIACHALNAFSDDFKALEDLVTSFIPHWQFDDVMATVSEKGASVGAHTDHYGVFILQGQGKRQWFIQEKPTQEFRENSEVKVLKKFKADYSWTLEPGDMIYVPPLCGHHGVTLEDAISYSIGFKALENQDIIKDYLFDFGQNFESEDFFVSKDESCQRNKYELTDEVVNHFHSSMMKSLDNKDLFKSWLAHKLSSQRYPVEVDTVEEPTEVLLDSNFTYYKQGDVYSCYLNQEHTELNKNQLMELSSILDKRVIDHKASLKVLDFLKRSAAIC